LRIDTSLGAVSNHLSIALELIRYFEGCRLKPYLCSAGKATIGYGATFYEDGTQVTLHDKPITQERATQLLAWMVRVKFTPAVRRLCPTLETPEQIAAIISWTFNLGDGNLRASTMRKKILAQMWDEVPSEIRKWNKAGGKLLAGLTRRRKAEAELFAQ
jgi:lysozyme